MLLFPCTYTQQVMISYKILKEKWIRQLRFLPVKDSRNLS